MSEMTCCRKPEISTESVIQLGTSCCGDKSGVIIERLHMLESVCRVALGAFAAMVNPFVGLTALAIGTAAGAAYHFYTYIKSGTKVESENRRPVCAQGYMETLSGMTFSPYSNQLATALFIGVHILHYPPFFVPFTGLFVGMWLGGRTVDVGLELKSKISR